MMVVVVVVVLVEVVVVGPNAMRKSVPDSLRKPLDGGLTRGLFGLPCVGCTSLGPGDCSAFASISGRFGGGADTPSVV